MRKHMTPGTRRVALDDLSKLQGYTPRAAGNRERSTAPDLQSLPQKLRTDISHRISTPSQEFVGVVAVRRKVESLVLPIGAHVFTLSVAMRPSHNPIFNDDIARIVTQSGYLEVEILVVGVWQSLLAHAKAFAEHLEIVHPSYASETPMTARPMASASQPASKL